MVTYNLLYLHHQTNTEPQPTKARYKMEITLTIGHNCEIINYSTNLLKNTIMDDVTFNRKFMYKIDVLNENRGEMSLKEYHFYSKENDPTYLNWLLGSHINDFGQGMTDEDQDLLTEFESIF